MPGKLRNPFEQQQAEASGEQDKRPAPVVPGKRPGRVRFPFGDDGGDEASREGSVPPTPSPRAPSHPTASPQSQSVSPPPTESPSPRRSTDLPGVQLIPKPGEPSPTSEPPEEAAPPEVKSEGYPFGRRPPMSTASPEDSPPPGDPNRPPTPSDSGDDSPPREGPVEAPKVQPSPTAVAVAEIEHLRSQLLALEKEKMDRMQQQQQDQQQQQQQQQQPQHRPEPFRWPTPPPQTLVVEVRTSSPESPPRVFPLPSSSTTLVPAVAPWEAPGATLQVVEVPVVQPREEPPPPSSSHSPDPVRLPTYYGEVDGLLPSMRQISATMDDLKDAMSGRKSTPPAPPPAPPPEPAKPDPELQQTMAAILKALTDLNTGIVSASTLNTANVTATHPPDATPPSVDVVPPHPPPATKPQPTIARPVPAQEPEDLKWQQQAIAQLRERLEGAELRQTIAALLADLQGMRTQQEENHQVQTDLLEIQMIQQEVMAQQQERQKQQLRSQQAVDLQQHIYLSQLSEYQRALHELLQSFAERNVAPVIQTPAAPQTPPQRPPDLLTQPCPAPALPIATPVLPIHPPIQTPLPDPAYTAPLELDEEVRDLLAYLRLERYAPLFAENQVTMRTMAYLTESDFIDMGITAIGPRKVLTRWIEEYRKAREPTKVPSTPAKPPPSDHVHRTPPTEPTPHQPTTPSVNHLEERLQDTERAVRAHRAYLSKKHARTSAVSAKPVPEDLQIKRWSAHHDPSTNKIYYFDRSSGKTQWEQPADIEYVDTAMLEHVL